jgi:hypothetical protein
MPRRERLAEAKEGYLSLTGRALWQVETRGCLSLAGNPLGHVYEAKECCESTEPSQDSLSHTL